MKYNNGKFLILSPEGFVDFVGVQKITKKTIELFFDNNMSLRGSYNHKIYDFDNKEILLKDIKINDRIKSFDGFLTINDIKIYEEESDVYDIVDCGELHLYYTNDIISHNCNFLGSGDNVFDSKQLQDIHKNMLCEPNNKMVGNSLWIWKEPEIGHKYIMGMDVSRGDSEDFTTFIIVDFDTREQVAEYVGKVPPDVAAEIAYKWGMMYNAYIVIDITGGMGVTASRKLQELGYKNLYIDGVELGNIWKYDQKVLDKIPGINFNNKRVQIISSFEEAMRHGFKIYSHRLFNEMNTFIYINGRPDHQKGHHDDLIMAIAMAIYVGENSFSQLEKVIQQTKVMINSWTINSNESVSETIAFNPVLPAGRPMGTSFQNEATKNDYQKYGWLFGNTRR